MAEEPKRRKKCPRKSVVSKELLPAAEAPVETPISVQDLVASIHLVTNEIFQYLNKKDLLNLSVVSRTWYNASRPYLKKKYQCLVAFKRLEGPNDLQRLIELLNNPIPTAMAPSNEQDHPLFNGVHFVFLSGNGDFFNTTLPMQDDCYVFRQVDRRVDVREVQKLLKIIFSKITMKYVLMLAPYRLCTPSYSVDYNATDLYFSPNKFERYFGTLPLKDIEYFRTDAPFYSFVKKMKAKQCEKLTTIRLDNFNNASDGNIWKLFQACPVLTTLEADLPASIVRIFSITGKANLIKSLRLTKFVEEKHFQMVAAAGLKLKKLNANDSQWPIGNWSYNHIIRLIHSNVSSLEELQIHEDCLKKLITSGVPPLPNLRKLNCFGRGFDRISTQRMFPRVSLEKTSLKFRN